MARFALSRCIQNDTLMFRDISVPSKHAAHRNQDLCFADAKCTVPVCAADVRTLFALAM